jgi:hypothetical protein
MKVSKKDMHKIIDRAKFEFINQPTRLYWDNENEFSYEEKRFAAILKAVSNVLNLEIEVENEKGK